MRKFRVGDRVRRIGIGGLSRFECGRLGYETEVLESYFCNIEGKWIIKHKGGTSSQDNWELVEPKKIHPHHDIIIAC